MSHMDLQSDHRHHACFQFEIGSLLDNRKNKKTLLGVAFERLKLFFWKQRPSLKKVPIPRVDWAKSALPLECGGSQLGFSTQGGDINSRIQRFQLDPATRS